MLTRFVMVVLLHMRDPKLRKLPGKFNTTAIFRDSDQEGAKESISSNGHLRSTPRVFKLSFENAWLQFGG
jgi:hypothetical protein